MFVTKLLQKTTGFLNRIARLTSISLSVIVLTACATPAHHNYSWFSDIDVNTVQVRVYAIDTYEVDGFFLDSKGLAQQIRKLKKINSLNKLLIEPKGNAALFEQAVALYIGEQNGLATYRARYFDTEEISSVQILAELDTPKPVFDIFSF